MYNVGQWYNYHASFWPERPRRGVIGMYSSGELGPKSL